MRVALVADVHGNLQALSVVLERLEVEGVDRLVCLGDVVGYGGDPEACLALLRERADLCVRGNHDAAAVDPRIRRGFNVVARAAIEEHAAWLEADALAFLAGLPQVDGLAEDGGLFLTHGTPGERRRFTYLVTALQAGDALDAFDERFGAVGHTHVPAVFEADAGPAGARERNVVTDGPAARDGERILEVGPGRRAILNPGSVGQPRDGDPRAACMVLDTAAGRAALLRLAYDVAGAQAAIRRRGLPEVLAARLAFGR